MTLFRFFAVVLIVMALITTPASPCGNVPTVADSNGGNAATGVFDDIVSFVCNQGHTTDGEVRGLATTESTCQANATWSSPESCEIISCSAHNTTGTNAVAEPSEGLTFGTLAHFFCDAGFGSFARQCQADGTWTDSNVVCEPCANGWFATAGNPCDSQCSAGSEPNSDSSWCTDCASGTWSSAGATECAIVACPDNAGSAPNCQCNAGWKGNLTFAGGSWANSDVACERVACGNAPTVDNSDAPTVDNSGFFGDTVTYACDADFSAAGTSQTSTCQSDATWSAVTCMTYTAVTIDTTVFALSITTGISPTGFDDVVNDNLMACVVTTATLADASEIKALFASYTGALVDLFTDAFEAEASAASAGTTTTAHTTNSNNFESMPAGKYTAICVQQKNSITDPTDWSDTNLNVIAQSASFDVTYADASSASTSTVSVVTTVSGMVLALVW